MAGLALADRLRLAATAELRRRAPELAFKGAPWSEICRPDQREPEGDWRYWIVLAGRGYGKTRVGAEWVVKHAYSGEYEYVNLIGATADDARDIMVEGESGIMAVCAGTAKDGQARPSMPRYIPSKRRIEWPNGCKSLIFTADEPERLRGKQHQKLWGDEIAAWRYEEAWRQATLGLRLGPSPQALLTTTPKPRAFLRKLLEHPASVVTRGTTYDNRANLAPEFFAEIIREYEGTSLGAQELNAVMLEEAEGALWRRSWIENTRAEEWPEDLVSLAIGVDPPGGTTLCGIVAAGMSEDGDLWVGCDRSEKLPPGGWAWKAIDLYEDMSADEIVAEGNFGGDMVVSTIGTAAQDLGVRAPVRLVHASRGKAPRAQPVAALWEQGRAHMVGENSDLEDEMCTYVPGVTKDSPNRMDAMVWAATATALAKRHVFAVMHH